MTTQTTSTTVVWSGLAQQQLPDSWAYGTYRLGKCKPCGKRFAWPATDGTLPRMACPICAQSLSRTTLLGTEPVQLLAAPPYCR